MLLLASILLVELLELVQLGRLCRDCRIRQEGCGPWHRLLALLQLLVLMQLLLLKLLLLLLFRHTVRTKLFLDRDFVLNFPRVRRGRLPLAAGSAGGAAAGRRGSTLRVFTCPDPDHFEVDASGQGGAETTVLAPTPGIEIIIIIILQPSVRVFEPASFCTAQPYADSGFDFTAILAPAPKPAFQKGVRRVSWAINPLEKGAINKFEVPVNLLIPNF